MPRSKSEIQVPLSLPQNINPVDAKERAFQLSIARTKYNYTRTYLEHVPLSADVPKEEQFSGPYKRKVVEALCPLLENFVAVVTDLWRNEIKENWQNDDDKAVMDTTAVCETDQGHHKKNDEHHDGFLDKLRDTVHEVEDFIKDKISGRIEEVEERVKIAENIKESAEDIKQIITGMKQVVQDAKEDGATAFLKSTLFYTLGHCYGGDHLTAKSEKDYQDLFTRHIETPKMLTIERQDWMVGDALPCQQDWYFGSLQTAGFNTTLLQGVRFDNQEAKSCCVLADLLKRCPLTDQILQSVLADDSVTVEKAVTEKRLYVVDYAMLDGAKTTPVHGRERYIAAAIAIFYWNDTPPAGYPPGLPALQPISIQLNQQFDQQKNPIFTPNDCADSNDANGLKWKVAKFVVNALMAIQHESVAHLGSCHLTIDPMVVCSHRQLSDQHPLMKLLDPHFKFTIQINNSAVHSLIIPRGVVATNVGPAIESTLQVIANAREAWLFDDNSPDVLFARRGVDKDALPTFAFRDDTLLLWEAIKTFTGQYLKEYYRSDEDVKNDTELQAWVSEMVKPTYAGFKGLSGLIMTDDPKAPARIESLDYLIKMVAEIIYIAGPQHGSVNFAQYPLMSYMPGVSGTIYAPMPTRADTLVDDSECLKWYPPLDIAMYTFLFEYLLSEVQYDTFGHYPDGYFTGDEVLIHVAALQLALAKAEKTINERNKKRPLTYPWQLPSILPNSISI